MPKSQCFLETGYAIDALGWDRTVLLFNEDALVRLLCDKNAGARNLLCWECDE